MNFVSARLKFIFILCGLLSGWGCMKNPDTSQDFGAEVSADSMQSAIDSIPSPEPLEILKGEFVAKETSLAVESMAPATTQQHADEVTERVEDGENVQLTVLTKTRERIDGEMKPPPPPPPPPAFKRRSALLTFEASRGFNSGHASFRNDEPDGGDEKFRRAGGGDGRIHRGRTRDVPQSEGWSHDFPGARKCSCASRLRGPYARAVLERFARLRCAI